MFLISLPQSVSATLGVGVHSRGPCRDDWGTVEMGCTYLVIFLNTAHPVSPGH